MQRINIPPTNSVFIGVVRCALGFIWLYEGLWKKILSPDALESQIVASAGSTLGVPGDTLLSAIGLGETLLAIVVISGIFYRIVAALQAGLLIAMNIAGITLGAGAIQVPADLLIHNIPFLLCAGMVGLYGPGAWSLRFESNNRNAS